MIEAILLLAALFLALDFAVPYTLLLHFGSALGSGPERDSSAFRRRYGLVAWPRTAALIATAVLAGLSGHHDGKLAPLLAAALLSGTLWFVLLGRDFVRAARQT